MSSGVPQEGFFSIFLFVVSCVLCSHLLSTMTPYDHPLLQLSDQVYLGTTKDILHWSGPCAWHIVWLIVLCLPISWFKPSCKHRISSGICHGWHWPRDNPSKQSEIAPNFVWLSQTISSHIDPRLWGRSIFLLQDSTYQRVSVQTNACSTFVNAPQQVHCWFWLDLCTLPY